MPTRTFKLMGDSDGTFTVEFNSSQVYTGSVDSEEGVLCTFTADTSVNGDIPVTVTVNSGELTTVKGLYANYTVFEDQVLNDDETPFSSSDVTDLFNPMNDYVVDSVKSPAINGTAIDLTDDSDFVGVVDRLLENGDVFTCNMVVDPIAVYQEM